jgi:DNA-directed RNA polymerase specialized sigma24 family protein
MPVNNDRSSGVLRRIVSKALDQSAYLVMREIHQADSTMESGRPKSEARAMSGYATKADFCQDLAEGLKPLYLLAFLLTGRHIDAERCFTSTVQEALTAHGVFKGWERSWSKRCLITHAIRLVVSGAPERGVPDSWCEFDGESTERSILNAIAGLVPPLQRFVFVMSVLEKYSDHECALLLGCTPRRVLEARIQALGQLSGFDSRLTKRAG